MHPRLRRTSSPNLFAGVAVGRVFAQAQAKQRSTLYNSSALRSYFSQTCSFGANGEFVSRNGAKTICYASFFKDLAQRSTAYSEYIVYRAQQHLVPGYHM